jgi:hypothetical protein
MENQLNNNIHYEDNIFLLKQFIKGMAWAKELTINPELFQLKFKNDILFLSKTSDILLEKLKNNPDLIKRVSHLQNISTLYDLLKKAIISIRNKKLLPVNIYDVTLEAINKSIDEIYLIVSSCNDSQIDSDQISNKELNILLSSDDED